MKPIKDFSCLWWGHKWQDDYEGNPMKRHCSHCGLVQWVMSKPYPNIGEPALFWKDMGYHK